MAIFGLSPFSWFRGVANKLNFQCKIRTIGLLLVLYDKLEKQQLAGKSRSHAWIPTGIATWTRYVWWWWFGWGDVVMYCETGQFFCQVLKNYTKTYIMLTFYGAFLLLAQLTDIKNTDTLWGILLCLVFLCLMYTIDFTGKLVLSC